MLKLKKMLAVATATFAAAGMLTVFAAASGTTGTVAVSGSLNVRSAGNTGAPIIGRLYDGVQVAITGSSNGWDKITFNGGTGWVSGVYVVSGKLQTVVSTAKSELGIRYIFGGASPSTGFDCSGLTMYAYNKVGISLPHSSAQQASRGWWVSRSALRPGDLLFFDTDGSNNGTVTHVGIYIGGGSFISAQSGGVKEASLSNSYWSAAFVTARRLTS